MFEANLVSFKEFGSYFSLKKSGGTALCTNCNGNESSVAGSGPPPSTRFTKTLFTAATALSGFTTVREFGV